MDGLRAA